MSPQRGELEGRDLVPFLDSALGDSHHMASRISLPSNDNLKLRHASLPNHTCIYDEFFTRRVPGPPRKYTVSDPAHMLMICSHIQT